MAATGHRRRLLSKEITRLGQKAIPHGLDTHHQNESYECHDSFRLVQSLRAPCVDASGDYVLIIAPASPGPLHNRFPSATFQFPT